MATLLIKNIGTADADRQFARGRQQGENRKSHQAAIPREDGIIKAITADGTCLAPKMRRIRSLMRRGNLVTPGLVDGNTHMVLAAIDRMRSRSSSSGAGYLDILRAGGGINDTVQKTRAASFEALYAKTEGFLDEMLELGVTTCEAKSGYGIDLETEVKPLTQGAGSESPDGCGFHVHACACRLADLKGREEFIQLCIDE